MFKNYFKTAFRNLSRNKSYALINITGLGIGIAACLLIFLVIQFETSFDNFHPKKNNIYRVGTKFHTEDGYSYSGGIAFPAGPVIKAELPQVKTEARIYQSTGEPVTIDYANAQTKKFKADLYYTEPDFFSMFNFPWLAGDPKTSLSKPNQAALTQKTAEKFFGDWHLALGKTITHSTNKGELYTITGIIKDVPANSDFPLDAVVSYSTLENTDVKRNLDDWVSTYSQAYVFVELPAAVSISQFNSQLDVLAKKHKPADYAQDSYVAQPLTEIHYDNRFGNYRSHTFSRSLVLALELIGIFLILIACVNFINLATAQAVNRSKEVGVRKVLGSDKNNLRIQFFSETTIITATSVILSVLIAFAALPFINKLLNVEMTLNIFKNPAVILFLISVLIVVTLLSGFYPAIILSGFNPITALKTKITSKMAGGISLRRVLVILQFSIAHILIIGMLIVVSQMNFFKNASLGFDKEAILNVPIPGDSVSHTKLDFIRNELSKNGDIKNVSFSFSSPASDGNWNTDFMFDHSTKNTNFNANLKWADPDYFKTYNIKFFAGRPYFPSDTVREFVVNETLLRKLGITDANQAIGKEIGLWDGLSFFTIFVVIRVFNYFYLMRVL